MKAIFKTLLFIVVFAISPAFAVQTMGTQVIQGSAVYTKTNCDPITVPNPRFYDLEQAGVERRAEQDAMNKCAAQGLLDCVIVSAATTACNYQTANSGMCTEIGCAATATARGSK